MKSRYFKIEELVCPHVYAKFGEKAEMFIDERLIETLDTIKEKILGGAITVNNWKQGGEFSQRGLRCNCCQIVKEKTEPYLSAHMLGKAVDFDVKGMSAEQARQAIIKAQVLLPYPIRMESGISWVHLDVYDGGSGKAIIFKR